MPKKQITRAERRHRDSLRREGLRVAAVYQSRLEKDRRKELRRVLEIAKDYQVGAVADVIAENIDESGYLPGWWQGLWTTIGTPYAQATAKELREAKAAAEADVWTATLRQYATTRAGNEIVIVSGTWKDSLVKIVQANLEAEPGIGIEKLTRQIYQDYLATLERWQCRRIAQTEAMIGMAEAGATAAETLDIPFTKQWCISGLGNTRASHELVDGLVVDQDEPFSLPGGMLMYPHDTSMGADASEIINCACDVIRRPKSYRYQAPPQPKPEPPVVKVPEVKPVLTEDQRLAEIIKEMSDSLPAETRLAIAKNDLELEKALGITKGKPMGLAKADQQHANPNYALNTGYKTNCATCTPAFILRTRGFDVTAKAKTPGSLNSSAAHGGLFRMWKNADGTMAKPVTTREWMKAKGYQRMNEKRYVEFFEEKCKAKGDYAISVRWKGEDTGHATILRRKADGKLVYIEPQVYEKGKGMELSILEICADASAKPWIGNGVMRVDDKLFDVSWAGLFDVQ